MNNRGVHRVELTLTAQEIAFLEILLTTGRSRPLARRMGRDRETLKRWQDCLRLKLTLAVRRGQESRKLTKEALARE